MFVFLIETPPIGLFLYNHEQVLSLIENKLNDEVWTETLVLEEAVRVQRPGPAQPPGKATKKPDKRKKTSKDQQTTEDSMYLLSNRLGTMEGVLGTTC